MELSRCVEVVCKLSSFTQLYNRKTARGQAVSNRGADECCCQWRVEGELLLSLDVCVASHGPQNGGNIPYCGLLGPARSDSLLHWSHLA